MIIHLVSHTHWDREWYLTAARFRQKLVALVDELIDAPPANGASFLLDGQMAVIEDYLAVRPERRGALADLLRKGAIEAGPWFVLADELIPSGEALVRNLHAGRRSLEALGASAPPVLYCPDSFGHPAAMPSLAAGFGFGTAIALRGFGGPRWPSGDSFRWIAPSGEGCLFYHFSKTGYDTGANLPADADAARERWKAIRDELEPRSTLGVTLLMNGADHHARQAALPEAIAALRAAAIATGDEVRAISLAAFVHDAEGRAAGKTLVAVRGELRDSYGLVWTLGGTLATRAHQKRRNAHVERLLVREAEPYLALLARRAGAPARRSLLQTAWRTLLLCHPHDTLCGCSTDDVARQMDARLDEAHVQAAGLRDDAILELIGHHPDVARDKKDVWKPMVVVRNAAARPRSGIAVLRLSTFLSDVKVGANASPGPIETAPRHTPAIGGATEVQILSREEAYEMTESPRHYPDLDLVSSAEALAWIPEVPGYGIRCFPQQKRGSREEVPHPARAEGRTIDNGLVHVDVGADGRIVYSHVGKGAQSRDLLWWECAEDLGDEYTPSPRAIKFEPTFENVVLLWKGPLRACYESHWHFGKGKEKITLKRQLIVDASARWMRIHIYGHNTASDLRLRLRIASGIASPSVWADAMFGPVERKPIVVSESDAKFEKPLATAPLHRYVSVFGADRGMTVFSDGLAEYEATPKGEVYVTLLRATGELSRQDIPERPGHAGWPIKTPGAQCHGPFDLRLAVMFHGARSTETIDEIERAADDILLPLTGATLRSALKLPSAVRGVELDGTGLAVSAIKESENGEWLVLRCVNLTAEHVAGTWRLPFDPTTVSLARLDETPAESIGSRGNAIQFRAAPRAAVTILVK